MIRVARRFFSNSIVRTWGGKLAKSPLIVSSLVATVPQDFPSKPFAVSEPKEFSHTFQLQQAASISVDSSIKVLSCCLQMLQTEYSAYASTLGSGITWLNMALEMDSLANGNFAIEDELIRIRNEVSAHKTKIGEMMFVFEETRTLLNSAAGISFLVGNELASGLASDHAYNSQLEVDKMKKGAENLEKTYLELQQKLIKKSKPKTDS